MIKRNRIWWVETHGLVLLLLCIRKHSKIWRAVMSRSEQRQMYFNDRKPFAELAPCYMRSHSSLVSLALWNDELVPWGMSKTCSPLENVQIRDLLQPSGRKGSAVSIEWNLLSFSTPGKAFLQYSGTVGQNQIFLCWQLFFFYWIFSSFFLGHPGDLAQLCIWHILMENVFYSKKWKFWWEISVFNISFL